MKRLILLALLGFFPACQKHEGSRAARIIHTNVGSLVPLPANTIASGYIDLIPVLFNFTATNIRVWIKDEYNGNWEEIVPNQVNVPTYVYDTSAHQLRFQNCVEGWGYAVTN